MQAVLNYEGVLRGAVAEVTNQASRVANLDAAFELKRQQVDALREAIEVSNRLFASARADYGEVLLTRREALESQMDLIETKQRQFDAMIGLYQALGGGWNRNSAPRVDGTGHLESEKEEESR